MPIPSDPNSDPSPAGCGAGMRENNEEEEDELSFMRKLKSANWERYCYQKDMIRVRFCPYPQIVYNLKRHKYDAYENQRFPIVQAMDLKGIKHYSFDELLQMTDNFGSTFICYTHNGTLHRGTIRTESGVKDVLVKTWEYFIPCNCAHLLHHTSRICDEVTLLTDPGITSHPNVVKLIGFHCERRLAVIYEGRSFELLYKIIPNDTFSWDDRMKVATGMASMLEAFHGNKLVHGGVSSKNIIVDEEKCPLVYDFSLFTYYDEEPGEYRQSVGKLYPMHYEILDGPPWSMECDIFAYGILLLELITKEVYPKFVVPVWTKEEILNYDHEKSAVHDSFYVDNHIALRITKLAIDCLKVLDEKLSIQHIARELKELLLYKRPNKQLKISS